MFILALFLAPSAHAGQWLFTYSGNPTVTQNPAQSSFAWNPPTAPVSSVSVSYQTGTFPNSSGASTTSETVKCPIQVTIAWSPSGTLASDPQPAFIRLAESGAATWGASGYYSTSPQTSVSGTGAAAIANIPASTVQYTTIPTLSHSVTESANLTLSPPANVSAGGSVGNTFSYSVQAVSVSPSLTVDQDQQVLAPAATTRFSATISNASGFTIDSVKISVDGTPAAATVNPNNSNNYYIDWPQTGGNPSEHSVTATAQIHDSVGALSLNSLDLPNRAFATCGMGRPADDIIADVRLQSIKFNNNIALNQDFVTPVPTPELTWTGSNITPTTANPAAYIQTQKVSFTMLLASSTGAALTGSAPLGYGLKLQANPNTVNPATNQADPALTLYDNTSGSPFAPTPCGSSITIAATTALNSWVSTYSTNFSPVSLYVEFTKLPTPVWASLGSYTNFGNTLYAVLATPTAPMATPWVPVLDRACNWARRTSDATSATTALAKAMYNTFTYNGYTTHTVRPNPDVDGVETFSLPRFLSDAQGDCRDFADFLASSSNAIGAKNLSVQRSDTVSNIDKGQIEFRTKNFIAAPYQQQAVPSSNSWVFHQWSVADNVYDACIGTTPTPLVNLPLSTYFSTLVDQTLPYRWNPQTAFMPTLSN